MTSIIELNLNDTYYTEIFGFGEVYEIVSVERLRKKLKKKYKTGKILLTSNRNHSDKGLTLEELIDYAKSKNLQIIEFGYVDCPPWQSKKRTKCGTITRNPIIITLAKIVFYFISLLEDITVSKYRAHMVYVFCK